MKDGLRSLLIFWLSFLSASALPEYRLDEVELGITSFRDPGYPIPTIGEREVFIRYEAKSDWLNHRVYLQYSSDRQGMFLPAFPDNTRFKRVEVDVTSLGGRVREASYVFRNKLPERICDGINPLTQLNCIEDEEIVEDFEDGETGFYRWVVTYEVDGAGRQETIVGDIHQFTMPRRLVFTVYGDSYGSGEGAPATHGDPWITEYAGRSAHRSAVSGSELTMHEFHLRKPNLAFDYVNVSSSGALARDIFSNKGQWTRIEDFRRVNGGSEPASQGPRRSQADLVQDWLAAKGYSVVDAALISAGGNDFGFGQIVTHYFGVPRSWTGVIAGCSVAGFLVPGVSIPVIVACIDAALDWDFSFKKGFNAQEISGGRERSLDWYSQELGRGYGSLKSRLERGLVIDSNGGRASVNRFFVTEYPNALWGCTGADYMDYEKKGPFNIGLKISKKESTEAVFQLAPAVARGAQPSGGGINHRLRSFVQGNGSHWKFVETGTLVAADGGLCRTNRQFVRRREAYDMAGPHEDTNAIHPNRLGHRTIYFPALRDALTAEISSKYREDEARRDGLLPSSIIKPDLAISEVSLVSWNAQSRLIEVEVEVVNLGGARTKGTQVELSVILPGENGSRGDLLIESLGSAEVAELDPNESRLISMSRVAGDAAGYLQLPCSEPGEDFVAANYLAKDLVLQELIPARFQIRAEAAAEGGDTNVANNRKDAVGTMAPHEQGLEIPPVVNAASRAQIYAELGAWTGGATPTRENLDFQNPDLLAYFGYCDAVARYHAEKSGQITLDDFWDFSEVLRGGSSARDPFEGICDPALRVFCYDKPGNQVTVPGMVSRLEAQLRDYEDFRANIQRDGRRIVAGFLLQDFLGGFSPIEFSVETPRLSGRLLGPSVLEPIGRQNVVFSMGLNADLMGVEMRVGSAPGGNDLHQGELMRNPGFKSRAKDGDETNLTLPVTGLPNDGRPYFVTLTSFSGDQSVYESEYRYESVPLNARLNFPLEGDEIGGDNVRFRWSAPQGGEVDGYRLWLGSYPGGRDIFGSDPGDESGQVGAGVNQLSVPPLPRDGRKIWVSLATLRVGEWHTESYLFSPGESNGGGVKEPFAGTRLGGRHLIRLEEGDDSIEGYRLSVGTEYGGQDLFSRTFNLDEDKSAWVNFPEVSEEGELVYLTVESERGGTIQKEVRAFERSPNATLISPAPGEILPKKGGQFIWQAPRSAESLRIRIGRTLGAADLFDEDVDPLAGEIELEWGESLDLLFVFVEIETVRESEEGRVKGVEKYAFFVERSGAYDYGSDDLDDFWQVWNFGYENPSARPDADPDGDGQSNALEASVGTDPLDRNNRWVARASVGATGGVTFATPLHPRGQYQVWRSPNLRDWFKLGPEIQPETIEENGTISRAGTGTGREYYRLEVLSGQ